MPRPENISNGDIPGVVFERGDDITTRVNRIARLGPGRTALADEQRSITYSELAETAASVASALVDSGVRRGDRVALLATNSVEYVQVFLGALEAGASVVPLPTLSSVDALRAMLEDCTPRVLFASAAYHDALEQADRARTPHRVGLDLGDRDWTSLSAFRAGRPGAAFPALGADDEFDVIYSSGTTGIPKGIVHSHGARKASYAGSRAAYFSPDTVNVVATPFYSNTTCITWLLTTAAGGTNVLLGKFSPDAFLSAVERHHATHAMLVPVQYDRILGSEKFQDSNVSSLRYLFSTSAPLRATTKKRILDETPADLIEIYGVTEGGPVTVLDARRHPDKLASVGVPTPGCDVRVIGEDARDVPRGHAGEIVGRSANMMTGYLNRPDETSALVFRDEAGALYYRSGDIGRFDEDGFLHLLDRKKDVIISGGFNVFATDLEAAMATHAAVAEVAVIGVPSERWGETPFAIVVVKAGSVVTEGELVEHANARLGKAQRVSGVEFRSELPKSAIGKVLKRELREPYWRGRM